MPWCKKERNLAQHMADDSQSGVVPLFGLMLLLGIVVAIISMVF